MECDKVSGRILQKYSDKQFTDAVQELDMATCGEIAERVGCSPRNAGIRLIRLASENIISKRAIGGRWVYAPIHGN